MDNNKDGGAKLSLRSISSLFCDTWKLYKERWTVLVEIVLLPTLVTMLGYILASLGSPFSIVGGLLIFIGWIIFMFSVLPVIFSIHNTTGVDASYKATIGWFWPFVWLTILEVLAVLGGSIMFIIPGIWLAFALSLMAYIFVIEHRRGIDALRQSKDYIQGYWWAVAGRVLLLCLLFLVATLVVEFPIALIAGKVAGNIVSMVLVLFFIPFSSIYHYVIFGNLRELKPDLVGANIKKGEGFIKASAIVGVVVPVLIILLLAIIIGTGMFRVLGRAEHYVSPPGYGMQSP